jgi:hypothetical protein
VNGVSYEAVKCIGPGTSHQFSEVCNMLVA